MPVVVGRVAGLSNTYEDGTERMEIHVGLAEAAGLPYEVDSRVPVRLRIESETYNAGLRSKRSNRLVWVCPDLWRADGTKVRLADALRRARLPKGSRVQLRVSGNTISVAPA